MDRLLAADEATLVRMERLLKRRFMGTGGIAVSATDDAVVIALRSPQLLAAGGGGSHLVWAKITSIADNLVNAKLADAEGNVDPEAQELHVYLCATAAEGVTWSPALAEASPRLVVGQYIWGVPMPACGAERPAGLWMLPPSLALTCAPSGEDADLVWLLANVAALRALVEGG